MNSEEFALLIQNSNAATLEIANIETTIQEANQARLERPRLEENFKRQTMETLVAQLNNPNYKQGEPLVVMVAETKPYMCTDPWRLIGVSHEIYMLLAHAAPQTGWFPYLHFSRGSGDRDVVHLMLAFGLRPGYVPTKSLILEIAHIPRFCFEDEVIPSYLEVAKWRYQLIQHIRADPVFYWNFRIGLGNPNIMPRSKNAVFDFDIPAQEVDERDVIELLECFLKSL